MKPIQRSISLLFLSLLAPAAGAQTPAATGVQILDQGHRIYASGPGGAAAFERGRVHFAASKSNPIVGGADLSFQLETIHVGEALVHAATGEVDARQRGDFASYEHTADLVERYEVRTDGIEQTFVFDSLPTRDGDLIVRGRLTTDLEIANADEIVGIVFENGLRYGGVTGIDATGATARGTIRLEGDQLALSLPAEFIANAEMPLVLDPLVGSLVGPIVRTDLADGDVDVAYRDSRYLVVFRDVDDRGVNPDFYSVSGIWLNFNGVPVSAPFAIWTNQANEVYEISTGTMQTALGTRWLVAWSRQVNITRDVEVRVFAAGQTSVGPHLSIGNTIWNEVRPDVAKRSDGPAATVVWERLGIRLEGAEIGVNALGQPVLLDSYQISGNGDDRYPAIARAGDQRFVVWHRDNDGTVVEEIMGRRWAGASGPGVSDQEFEIDQASLGYLTVDCAAASEDDFYVVWDYGYLGSGGDVDVYGRRVWFPAGDGTLPQVGARTTIEFDSLESNFDPQVMFTGDSYMVTYQRSFSGNYFLDAEIIDSMTGETLDSFPLQFATGYGGHAIAPVEMTALDNDIGMAVWTAISVFGHRFESEGGLSTDLGGGCPVLGGETRTSTLTSPNPAFQVELWGGEPFSGAYLAVGDNSIDVPVGGAILVPDPAVTSAYFAGTTDGDGYIAFDLPIPPGLGGAVAFVQWVTLAAGSTCTPYPVNLSDAVKVGVD